MPRTGTDRFEQRKATRAKLVDAAFKLFATSGYEHATVDDISNEAGYSKGAYYFHFSTKDDILLELLRMWTEGRTNALAAGVVEGEPENSVRGMLEGLFSYDDAPRWPAVLLEFWSQALRHKDVSKRLSQAYAAWRHQLAEAFAAAAASGALQLDSADDAASIALAAHDGHAVQVAIGSPGARAMTAAELADSLLAPLKVAQPAARSVAAAG
jgi:AcrR family transcriptional regulator